MPKDGVRRLDQHLAATGLADSRSRAREMVLAGLVAVDGVVVAKPAYPVGPDASVTLVGVPSPWVSRAALKLTHALDVFGLTPSGDALDIGASTGGFTEVLLARGVARVFALDVGQGQLHPRLADDPRVVSIEGVNARDIPPGLIPPVDWLVADISFISLEKALPTALTLAKTGARLVALIKPQFEAGRKAVGKGGVVRDPEIHETVRKRIRRFLAAQGWTVTGEAESPITGSDGNIEFLIAALKD